MPKEFFSRSGFTPFFILSAVFLFVSCSPVMGIPSPAAVYCEELGYVWERVGTDAGEAGVCNFPDKSSCSDWDFFEGKCGEEHSYCARKGYELKTGEGCCWSQECSVCVLPDKAEASVMSLMGLDERMAGKPMRGVGGFAGEREGAISLDGKIGETPNFDWRNMDGENWMTPVKDQGSCGSCWAFAGLGVEESQINIQNNYSGIDVDLSEQYLVSTCFSYGDCGGLYAYDIDELFDFLRDTGTTDELCYPYLETNSLCSGRCSTWSDRLWTIKNWSFVEENQTEIKQSLMDVGPLWVGIGVGIAFGGSFDGDGIYRCTDDSGINHAVVLVGFNDTGSYWIIRNSWGADWGDDGYFKVGYGECNVDAYVSGYPDIVYATGRDYQSERNITVYSPIMHTYTISTDMEIVLTINPTNLNYTNISIKRGNSVVNSTTKSIGGTYAVNLSVPSSGGYNVTVTRYDLSGGSSSITVQNVTVYYFDVQNPAEILLVDDDKVDGYESYYGNALYANGYDYDYWTVYHWGSPTLETLSDYPIVIWFTGDDFSTTLTSADQDNLSAYLDSGKSLFLSGQDIGWDITGTSFYSDYLHAQYIDDDTGIYALEGVSGDPIGNGLEIGISGGDGADNQLWPSEIESADANSTCVFNYSGDGCGAVRASTSDYRVVYLAFGFEAINDSTDRTLVMERIVTWLDTIPPTVDFISPTPPEGAEVDSNTIVINVSHTEVDPGTLVLYVNGTPNLYPYSGNHTDITKILANGFYNYSVWLNDSAGNWNQTEVRNLTVNATPPTVVLISPGNGSFSNGGVNLTCNATENVQLKNICLYWNYSGSWGSDECTNLSGTLNSTTFVKNGLSDSSVAWNCRACDNSSNCAFAMDNLSFIVDATEPTIDSYLIDPKIVINGSNVTLSINVTNAYLDKTWVSVDLPDLTQAVLDLPVDFTANITGRYNVTFFANDSAGNLANATDYFISSEGMQFNSSSVDYNNSGLNVSLMVYFDGSLIVWNQSVGNIALYTAEYIYDLEFSIFSDSLIVLLRGVNLSENNNLTIGFDKLTISGYLITYAVNSLYGMESATLNLSYSDTGYGNGNYLGIYKCDDWNFSGRDCTGNWERVTDGVHNELAGESFLVNVSGFSAFSIEPLCSDGTESGECSSTKPKYCDNGTIVDKCSTCGCTSGKLCNSGTGVCYTPTTDGGSSGGSSGGGGSYGAKPLPSCFDGIENCHGGLCEEDVDCGGPCGPCMSCSDGIQNQGEEGVDCGGPCEPCSVTTTLTTTTTTLERGTTWITATTLIMVTTTTEVTTTTIAQESVELDPIPALSIISIEIFLIAVLYNRYKKHMRREERKEFNHIEGEVKRKKGNL